MNSRLIEKKVAGTNGFITDQGLVTSRRSAGIPQFNEKMIEEFGEEYHAGQQRSSQARSSP